MPQQPQTQAPDTLPADFFSNPSASQPRNAIPSNNVQSQAAAPDTLPADFFTKQQAAQPVAQTPPIATISAVHQPTSYLGRLAQWTENVSRDLQDGGDRTGVGTVMQKLGAHGLHSGNSEAVGDFMGSLPLGLLKVAKGGTEIAPQVVGGPQGKTWQGVKDLVSGGLQAATIPTAFVAPEESVLSKEGLLSDAASTAEKTTAATGKAASTVKTAVTKPLSTAEIQPSLQKGVRSILSDVSKDTGTTESTAKSIRDVAEDTGNAVTAKAKGQYKVLDDATNGRVQRFTDRLKTIRDQLNELTGTEEDIQKEAKLLKAQKETEDSMQEAFEDARKSGVDPKIVEDASTNFKKGQAILDLDNAVKKSTSGMRPGIGSAKSAARNPEAIDPSKLMNRINGLYDSGRLQQALGENGANQFLEHVNDHVVQMRKVLRNQKIAKTLATGAGLGAGLEGVKAVTHVFMPSTGSIAPIE